MVQELLFFAQFHWEIGSASFRFPIALSEDYLRKTREGDDRLYDSVRGDTLPEYARAVQRELRAQTSWKHATVEHVSSFDSNWTLYGYGVTPRDDEYTGTHLLISFND